MTRGRRREHYQWNVELLGEAGVTAEAELISAIFCLLDALGLPRGSVQLRLNSRALLEEALRAGVLASRPELFEPVCVSTRVFTPASRANRAASSVPVWPGASPLASMAS